MAVNEEEVIYSLNIEDIQTVAIEELGRQLTRSEIEVVKELVGKKISWYDVIADSIIEFLEDKDTDGNS